MAGSVLEPTLYQCVSLYVCVQIIQFVFHIIALEIDVGTKGACVGPWSWGGSGVEKGKQTLIIGKEVGA